MEMEPHKSYVFLYDYRYFLTGSGRKINLLICFFYIGRCCICKKCTQFAQLVDNLFITQLV